MYDMKKLVFIAVLDFVIIELLYYTKVVSSSNIDTMVKENKKRSQPPLICHVCHSQGQTKCENFTEYGEDFPGFPQQCDAEETSCMVRKFAFTLTNETTTLPMKTIAVKRNCTKTCEPGCIIMGERTRLYICNTCCKSALCNVGSGTDSITLQSIARWNQLLLLITPLIFYLP